MRSVYTFAIILAFCVVPAAAQTVTQPFTFNPVPHGLPHLQHGGAAWGDMDGDGDLDVAMTGWTGTTGLSVVYRNDGATSESVTFTPVPLDAPALQFSSLAWGDMDGDGDLDLLLTGTPDELEPFAAFGSVFRNTGSGFERVENAGVPAAYGGSATWGDADNDGDLDIIITGIASDGARTTVLSLNDGTGQFTDSDSGLPHVAFGDVQMKDLDADGRQDILLSGVSRADGFISELWMGSTDGFSASGTTLPAVAFSSVDTGDFDGDGDLDMLISGGRVTQAIFSGSTTLYRNTNGTFQAEDTELAGVLAGRSTMGDYDNDGDMDIFVLGAEEALGRRTARLYRNEAGGFVNESLLVGSLFSDASWGDIEGDGDLDLITTGLTSDGNASTILYLNQRQVIPPPPSTPSLLAVEATDRTAHLRWEAPSDGAGLTFNLRVGSRPGASDIMASQSDPETGRRLVPAPGNVSALTAWSLENLDEGTYYWSVQSVNHALTGSPFSAEGVFSISGAISTDTETDATLPTAFGIQSVYPNPFRDVATIVLDLPEPTAVRVRVYSTLGARVADVDYGLLAAGTHSVPWSARQVTGRPLAAGLYFFELTAGTDVRTGSFTLMPGL